MRFQMHGRSGKTSHLPFIEPPHGPFRICFGQRMGHVSPVDLRTHCPHIEQSNSGTLANCSPTSTRRMYHGFAFTLKNIVYPLFSNPLVRQLLGSRISLSPPLQATERRMSDQNNEKRTDVRVQKRRLGTHTPSRRFWLRSGLSANLRGAGSTLFRARSWQRPRRSPRPRHNSLRQSDRRISA